jgi:membrane-bound acyltransferase YfiQ involved in biofilm formation
MVKILILIVIAILVLSFFGITIQSIVQSPAGQANFAYIWSLIVMGWNWIVTFVQSKSTVLQHAASKA